MAEQAHFAKYKISLKNNNKESQQVNEATGQQVNEDMRGRKSKIRNIEISKNSRIREFMRVDKWKKEEKFLRFLLL